MTTTETNKNVPKRINKAREKRMKKIALLRVAEKEAAANEPVKTEEILSRFISFGSKG